MIRAKLEMNTESIKINGEVRCAYCGKKIEPDTEIDHHEETSYYHCDCEDALKEIYLRQEIKKTIEENKNKIIKLESQFPQIKYKKEKKEVLTLI